ncbi:hypothetical protein [Shewanella gelidii]|uniref:Uncharacterized protein n=1 Tax=Shewanella gelidii TaxID=1642821 RepID=A0A917JPQ5_9GAMM|nr:hypothetical protein [Shewanella gelidii]MCL1099510.1 hypothetical protein [Shewanella gelidii]GGI77469.1 hypothetical protein GCM10009332_13590 [Shewanella gelidii]
MPIYIKVEGSKETITILSKGVWDLPTQIQELESWLFENSLNLPSSNYIADVGFSIRENACGGGAILSPKVMSIMGKLGIKLYLSEYGE